jgi:recombination protein RecT
MAENRNSVRGAVEKRRAAGNQIVDPAVQFAAVREELLKQRAWFESVAPSHIDARQFIALCFNVVKESDWQLQKALVEAPRTFFAAATECAQMGLIPGKTYHFVAFNNTVKGRNGAADTKQMQVTGIVDYKGELDMIYRAGAVRAVHWDVVRQNDTFKWRPGMEIPYHVIHAPEYAPEQEGLGDDLERGYLTGVYAYAAMMDGGFSKPVVLGKSAVMKYRARAKTMQFWGPDWPLEGPDTQAMWIKTALHRVYRTVPHSAEYAANLMRSSAALTEAPRSQALPAAPPSPVRELAGVVTPADNPDAPPEPPFDAGAENAPV